MTATTNRLNLPMIRLLVRKDWQLFEKWMALYVVAGIGALCLIAHGKPWSFYLGSLLLIIVLVAVSCFSISTSLLAERKDRTLPFIMSLPVSPFDFWLAKIVGNALTFAVPMLVLAAGTFLVVWYTPLPDGLLVLAALVFGHVLLAFCVSLSVAMAVESEGWNVFAMIASATLINPFLMAIGQVPAIAEPIRADVVSWSGPALAILGGQALLSAAVLAFTGWYHCRKTAFY